MGVPVPDAKLDQATRSPKTELDTAAVDLLLFEVGGQRFALWAREVEHLVRATAIAALPSAPAIIDGVVNVHGEIVPVVDLAARFGLPRSPLSPAQHFIFARAGARRVALRVDRAVELIAVLRCDIKPPGQVAPGASHVAGIAAIPGGVIVIQDLGQTLSLEDLARLDAALEAESGVAVPGQGMNG
jgi:purine-binding chemotaxis protein CheW